MDPTPTSPQQEPFVHLCAECGAWGSYGQPDGRWYCREHDPCEGKGSEGKAPPRR